MHIDDAGAFSSASIFSICFETDGQQLAPRYSVNICGSQLLPFLYFFEIMRHAVLGRLSNCERADVLCTNYCCPIISVVAVIAVSVAITVAVTVTVAEHDNSFVATLSSPRIAAKQFFQLAFTFTRRICTVLILL